MNASSIGAPARAIAVVGASERQFFARWVLQNLQRTASGGAILPVNRRGGKVLGMRTWPSIAELPIDPDLGIIALRPESCREAAQALVERGCRTIVVISDGFGESGTAQGRELEAALAAWARDHDVVLLGPNCVGLADMTTGLVAVGMPMPTMVPGPVSVISQSGGLLSSMVDALHANGLGIDLALSLGNGAVFDLGDAIETCVTRPNTSIVVAYVESLGSNVPRVVSAIRRLRADGRPLIVVKPGRSETAQQVVRSHTASIAGDDAAVDALLVRHGVVRVDDIGDLARAARLALVVPELSAERGVAVLGASGGSASIVGDLAMLHDVPLSDFVASTRARLAELVAASGHIGNPVDLSGRAADVSQEEVYRTIATDEHVDAIVVPFSAPFPDDDPARASHRDYLESIATVTDEGRAALVVASMGPQRVTTWIRSYEERHRSVAVVEGMAPTMRALGALAVGRSRRLAGGSSPVVDQPADPRCEVTVHSEVVGRSRLARIGFPVVSGLELDHDGELPEAVASLRYPVVVKAIMPEVAHKAAVGGVELGVCDVAGVEAARRRVLDRCARHGAVATGVLVQEMVAGLELLIGVVDHSMVGPILTVGLGGGLAETTSHHATALLPLDVDGGWVDLVDRAGLSRLLESDAGNLVGGQVRSLTDAFVSGVLGDLVTIEINPLFVTHDGRVLAGDVLAIERPPMTSSDPRRNGTDSR